MCKKCLLFIILSISADSIAQDRLSENNLYRCQDENCYKESIERIITLILPEGSQVESIEKSEFPGIYKVYYGDIQPLYVSENGNYFIYGQMFKIEMQTASMASDGSAFGVEPIVSNLTDLNMLEKRISFMQEIKKSELISFESDDQKHEITVFTDVDCTYCRKLHKEIKQYNDMGITVRYAAFPRSGLGTDVFNKMVGAWCSFDSKKAITNLKNGKNPSLDFCDSQPVAKHYAIGKKIGITGTPAIVTEEGQLLPGYYSAEDLLKKLKG